MYDANKEFDVVFQYSSADFGDFSLLKPDFTICPGPCVVVISVISTLRYRNPNILSSHLMETLLERLY